MTVWNCRLPLPGTWNDSRISRHIPSISRPLPPRVNVSAAHEWAPGEFRPSDLLNNGVQWLFTWRSTRDVQIHYLLFVRVFVVGYVAGGSRFASRGARKFGYGVFLFVFRENVCPSAVEFSRMDYERMFGESLFFFFNSWLVVFLKYFSVKNFVYFFAIQFGHKLNIRRLQHWNFLLQNITFLFTF